MTGAIVIFVLCLAKVLIENHKQKNAVPRQNFSPPVDDTDIVYNGSTGTVGVAETRSILEKHSPYYNALDPHLRERFLLRTGRFMKAKVFIIKNNEGYREMPVLVSAAAIQLTLGIDDYLLPFYRYIRIYPREYVGDDHLKILAGNVQNNVITVAWNHFLDGNNNPADGCNVGLHEMSHALYFQKLVVEAHSSKLFSGKFRQLLTACKEAHYAELSGYKNLFSSYADTDLQEVWAESIELFFEKPGHLHAQYPGVYNALKQLLNQDPLHKAFPLHQDKTSFSRKLIKFLGLPKA